MQHSAVWQDRSVDACPHSAPIFVAWFWLQRNRASLCPESQLISSDGRGHIRPAHSLTRRPLKRQGKPHKCLPWFKLPQDPDMIFRESIDPRRVLTGLSHPYISHPHFCCHDLAVAGIRWIGIYYVKAGESLGLILHSHRPGLLTKAIEMAATALSGTGAIRSCQPTGWRSAGPGHLSSARVDGCRPLKDTAGPHKCWEDKVEKEGKKQRTPESSIINLSELTVLGIKNKSLKYWNIILCFYWIFQTIMIKYIFLILLINILHSWFWRGCLFSNETRQGGIHTPGEWLTRTRTHTHAHR